MQNNDRVWVPWALVSAIFVTGFVGIVFVDQANGTLRSGSVDTTIGWYLVSIVGFVFAVWWNERHPIGWRWLWIVAIVVRLLLLTTTPTLSDDVYRYIWEGHLISEGVSPYAAPILDSSLDAYDISARLLVNNPTLASPYLPAAHVAFGGAVTVLPSSPITMQTMMVGFELAAAGGLVMLLNLVGLARERVLLWLWNPLVIIEVAHGAHVDALMIALTVAALVLTFRTGLARSRPAFVLAPILLALATLTRPLPMLLLPVLFWRWRWSQRLLYVATIVGAIVPFGLWSGFGLGGDASGTGVFGSARIYTETFRFNTAVYQAVEGWVASQGLDDRGWNEPVALTRLIVALAVIAILGWVWLRARNVSSALDALRLAAVPVIGYVLLAPVYHPWYGLLLFALLIFHTPLPGEGALRWSLLAPWAWLAGATVFSYLTYRDPANFAELVWVRRLEWWPVLVGGAFVLALQRRSSTVTA
ncbi:MAG: alpha-1,6-mannosyltransferase [Verrucomicrobiales bacterium]